MMRQRLIRWGSAGVLVGLIATLGLATGQPVAVVLRLTDMASLPSPPPPTSPDGNAPEAPASPWLRQQGWERVWPLFVEDHPSLQVTFAGPPAQRYLHLTADKAFTIWAHRLHRRSAAVPDPGHYLGRRALSQRRGARSPGPQ